MVDRVEIHDTKTILRTIRKEVLRELRREARRARKVIRTEAPKNSGVLRRKLKVKAGWDAAGPWARVVTTARNPKTRYRYGLAIQQQKHYLQRGLQRTPRR